MLKRLAIMFCSAVLLLTVADAQTQWEKQTKVTFTRPVELPRIVLQPGTYLFKLVAADQSRNIVGVYSEDGMHFYTSILAIPNYRLTPTDQTVLRFEERPVNMPEAIRAWFYPGDNFGQEFVYPKKKAAELAATAKIPVLTAAITPAEEPKELMKEPVVEVTPEAKEVEAPQVTETRPVETPAPVIAKAEPAPQPAPAEELPKTASPLPALVLVGFGSLGIVVILRAVSKRTA